MNFSSYRWLALVVLLLGLLVLHQGWNHGSLDQNSMQVSPAASSAPKSMNSTGGSSQTGAPKSMNSTGGNGQ